MTEEKKLTLEDVQNSFNDIELSDGVGIGMVQYNDDNSMSDEEFDKFLSIMNLQSQKKNTNSFADNFEKVVETSKDVDKAEREKYHNQNNHDIKCSADDILNCEFD